MRFSSLGSGSSGNAWLVHRGDTCLMLDCGFSVRETRRRLARLGLDVTDLDGILVSHEHGDHLGGVFNLAARHGIDVWLTHGTKMSGKPPPEALPHLRLIDSHTAFQVGEILVCPYPVPHDAREPVQFVFAAGGRRLGVLTDAGHVTPHMFSVLSGCDALVLESNHDLDLLWRGAYPAFLKKRVAGPLGHLNNGQAAELLVSLDRSRLQHVVAAHLSQQNNSPERVLAAVAAALGAIPHWFSLADQESGCGWREIR